MPHIISLQNTRIKHVVKLRKRSYRQASGRSIVEGLGELLTAVKTGHKIVSLYICPSIIEPDIHDNIVSVLGSSQCEMVEISSEVYEKISYGNRMDGFLAELDTSYQPLSWKTNRKGVVVVLVGIEKPGNIGAILRTCDAARIGGLILCDCSTDLFNPNVIRSSRGAVFSVPVRCMNQDEALQFLQKEKLKIFAATPEATVRYDTVDFTIPSIAIVLGNEHHGLDEVWKKECAQTIGIPLFGMVNSLNVSNCAAILIYESLKQKN